MHAFPLDSELRNGNDLSIGIVIKNDKDSITKMVSRTIRNLTVGENELWSLVNGLRSAFSEREEKVKLKTYSPTRYISKHSN